jgi:hypothetical protein
MDQSAGHFSESFNHRRRGRPECGCTRLSRKFDLLILCARIGFRP